MDASIIVWYLLYISSAIGQFPDTHIIGGCNANIKNFPYQVSIRYITNGEHQCGGVIITEKFVLTAAHCVIRSLMKIHCIYVGSSYLSRNGQSYLIDKAISYSGFTSKTRINDIAIIALKDKFNFSVEHHIMPIKIYLGHIPVDSILTVSGWGRIKFKDKYIPTDRLQKTHVPIIRLSLCQYYLNRAVYPIISKQFCTFVAGKNIGTCKGDSGGPVTLRGMLVGLVSWGLPCAIGKPDVYTRVSSFASWITKTINKYCRHNPCPQNGTHPTYVLERKPTKRR